MNLLFPHNILLYYFIPFLSGMQKPTELTLHCIQTVTESKKGVSVSTIAQILNPTLLQKKNNISCVISDGTYYLKCLIGQDIPLHEYFRADVTNLDKCIILVDTYSYINRFAIILENFKVLYKCQNKIGDPVDYFTEFQKASPHATNKTTKVNAFLPKHQENIPEMSETKPEKKYEHSQKALDKIQPINTINSVSTSANSNSKVPKILETGTIKDLYTGIDNWQIISRIIGKDYRQFTNKKGKLTKILNLTLIDRSKIKISAVSFGQTGKQLNQYLKLDEVYHICRGQVIEDDFIKSKSDNQSHYKIILNERAVFQSLGDVEEVPRGNEDILTLSQVYSQKIFEQQFDVVAVLVHIGQLVVIPKEDRNIKKRTLIVCDPQRHITMQVIIWNQKTQPDISLVNKTILLSSFRLKQWKDTISLASNMRSKIQLLKQHRFRKFQNTITPVTYTNVSEKKLEEEVVYPINNLSSLKRQLQISKEKQDGDKNVRSELNLFVSDISIDKNWFYQGCPNSKCKKAVKANSNYCQKCETQVYATIPHFIMNVDLSDSTGTIKVTAYDDFAYKILTGHDLTEQNIQANEHLIEELKAMSSSQRANQITKHLFKEFKICLVSSYDLKGQVKHKLSKFCEVEPNECSKRNMKMITDMKADIKIKS